MPATANGKDVLYATIQEPRIGRWTATIDVDSDVSMSGQVTLAVDGATWVGTIMHGDLFAGRVHAQVVGGAGKLDTQLDAKYYLGVPLSVVLQDIMLGTGEQLSAASDATVTSHVVTRWARLQSKAGLALRQVGEEIPGISWRTLRDGTQWLGAETWPTVSIDYDEIDKSPSRDSMIIAPNDAPPSVAPGTVFNGRHVSRVTTIVEPGKLRQQLLFQADGDSDDRGPLADIQAVIGSYVDTRIDLGYAYPAKVIKQASDGTLELLCDDAIMRGTGLKRVPIRHGIPGVVVTVPPGGKVLLMFEGGDQKRPIAVLWPDGSSVNQVQITTGTLKVVGDLEVSGEVTARSGNPATKVTLSGHIHPTAMGPSDKPTPGL